VTAPTFETQGKKEVVMAKQDSGNFEIPAEMRAFAEKSVDQARQAFDSFVSAAQHAVATADRQVAGTRAGAQELGSLAVRFAERNIATSFEFAERMVRAKNAEEVLTLQADYVKSQMVALNEQAKELSQQAAKMAKPAT
jgi:phasin